jgi:alpha-ketoglutarate-dependent 2,4-dichlorophenoxyacetate dioxygenase
MTLGIRQVGPCFAGEVSGIDLTKPFADEDAAAIHAGMDEYAVIVFHGQDLSDEQQLAFSRGLGDLEEAVGTSLRGKDE